MTNPRVKCPSCGEVMKTAKDFRSIEEFGLYFAMQKWDFPIKRGIFRHKHSDGWADAEYEWHDTPGAEQIPGNTKVSGGFPGKKRSEMFLQQKHLA